MAKRKRSGEGSEAINGQQKKANTSTTSSLPSPPLTIQIVTGSYERVLHGFQATISNVNSNDASAQFVDTFLFNAHQSAIRCLALSPLPDEKTLSENSRIILASGGTDERINLYSLSTSPLTESDKLPMVPTLAGNKILENPANRELGSLLQHNATITAICFPTRSKILAAGEDNTISISRTKDFEVASTIKVPRPKRQGQPSGDTSPPGGSPVGVNDFAVHPSMKLMVSVGKGEKSMRLWNLVTGKKAGVLNFSRDVLESVKEGKYSSGEGRKIEWNPNGGEFAVAFERGVVVYGIDSVPICKALPMPLTKLHQMRYVSISTKGKSSSLLAVSTEDGRVMFYNTTVSEDPKKEDSKSNPDAVIVAQLGGKAADLAGRIKDFEVLSVPSTKDLVVVTAGSDGAVRVWSLTSSELQPEKSSKKVAASPKQVGKLIGTYETGNRVTCLQGFVMLPPSQEDLEAEDGLTEAEEDGDEDEVSSGSEDSE